VTRRFQCFLIMLVIGVAACATRSGHVRELVFANATRATVMAPDSGASVICVASAASREPLRAVRVAIPATGAEAMTGPDGCATLTQPVSQLSLRVGRLGFTPQRMTVTVRRGYADTVRVVLHAGSAPSEEECARARRAGQGCL
jgi:hypothetical protein